MHSTPPFLLIGNVENRRVQMFCAALRKLNQPDPVLLTHLELIENPTRLECIEDTPHLVRIDAAGENPEVDQLLLALGYEAASQAGVSSVSPEQLRAHPLQHGEVRCPRQYHLGFVRYLENLSTLLDERPSWHPLSPIPSILELFDKRAASRRYRALGIPVPEVLDDPVTSAGDLRAAARQRGWSSLFVKLSSASSASCLAVYQVEPNVVMTTIRRRPNGWFNSLRVQRVEDPAGVEEVLAFLLREGSQIERAIPKARLDNAYFDCRVLVVDGEPAFRVVRQNSHPITNLHLGGWRGDQAAFDQLVPEDTWDAALRSCARVADAHGCFQLGVDVMIEPDLRAHRILEANAFGDLLPGLVHEGHSVYAWEILRAQAWAERHRQRMMQRPID